MDLTSTVMAKRQKEKIATYQRAHFEGAFGLDEGKRKEMAFSCFVEY